MPLPCQPCSSILPILLVFLLEKYNFGGRNQKTPPPEVGGGEKSQHLFSFFLFGIGFFLFGIGFCCQLRNDGYVLNQFAEAVGKERTNP